LDELLRSDRKLGATTIESGVSLVSLLEGSVGFPSSQARAPDMAVLSPERLISAGIRGAAEASAGKSRENASSILLRRLEEH